MFVCLFVVLFEVLFVCLLSHCSVGFLKAVSFFLWSYFCLLAFFFFADGSWLGLNIIILEYYYTFHSLFNANVLYTRNKGIQLSIPVFFHAVKGVYLLPCLGQNGW